MTAAATEHPGLLAAVKHQEYVACVTRSKELRARAATLRREAKAAKLKVDAFKLRLDAKAATDEWDALRLRAQGIKPEIVDGIRESARLLTERMPQEYPQWGFTKTRAYKNLLGIVNRQSELAEPNLALAVSAIQRLLTHQTWPEQVMAKLASISSMPKSLD